MTNFRTFPIMKTGVGGHGTIPWDFIAPHEQQAQKNHRQSLERLAERGGLSWCEALAVVTDKDWKPDRQAKQKLLAEMVKWQAVNSPLWFDFPPPQQHENPQPEGVEETGLPDFRTIWKVAREHGYSVGLHGSMRRDVDLIAVPWVENHSTPEKLVDALCTALNARMASGFENKPSGRVAINLMIEGWYRLIDLSIMTFIPVQEETSIGFYKEKASEYSEIISVLVGALKDCRDRYKNLLDGKTLTRLHGDTSNAMYQELEVIIEPALKKAIING